MLEDEMAGSFWVSEWLPVSGGGDGVLRTEPFRETGRVVVLGVRGW